MSIRDFFRLDPPPARLWDESLQKDSLHIRIHPQSHEIVIPPPMIGGNSSMSPQQQLEYEIVHRLQDAAVSAAHLVIHGGLEAYHRQKMPMEKTADLVTWVVLEKDKQLAAADRRIQDLEKQLAEVTTERNAMERILKR